MALEKIQIVDRIEVLENGSVQVRTKTAIKEDGVEINSKFHRHVIAPGELDKMEDPQDPRVQAICAVTHTADVVAAYQAAQEAAQTIVAQPE
jgi:hypothetical protein